MPRPLRIERPGAVYYVSNCRADDQLLFQSPADAEQFLQILAETAAANDWRCLGYCLLAKEYHLVIRTERATLSQGMQILGTRYTEAFCRRNGWQGRVFKGRYKAILVEPGRYSVALMRYIFFSPVSNGLAKHPAIWRWSSYRYTAGTAEPPKYLDIGWLVGPFGTSLPDAQAAWHADMAESCKYAADIAEWGKKLKRRAILGSPEFASQYRKRGIKARPNLERPLRGQAP